MTAQRKGARRGCTGGRQDRQPGEWGGLPKFCESRSVRDHVDPDRTRETGARRSTVAGLVDASGKQRGRIAIERLGRRATQVVAAQPDVRAACGRRRTRVRGARAGLRSLVRSRLRDARSTRAWRRLTAARVAERPWDSRRCSSWRAPSWLPAKTGLLARGDAPHDPKSPRFEFVTGLYAPWRLISETNVFNLTDQHLE